MKTQRIRPLRAALSLFIAASALLGAADYCINDTESLRFGDALPANSLIKIMPASKELSTAGGETTRHVAKLFGLLPLKSVTVYRYDDIRLCPGGVPFGVKMFTEGLLVVGFSDVDTKDPVKQPAYAAGLRLHDVILKVNGTPVTSSTHMAELVGASGGNPLEFTVRRGENELTVTMVPVFSEEEKTYKTGMWVRDNTAGIGTVTFVDPRDGTFAGLGHGICDGETGALLPLSRGVIANVSISGVRKGAAGSPGELKGYFSSGKIGALIGNTAAGVFGILTELPAGIGKDAALPIALKQEIHDGPAVLYCTLDDGGIGAYSVNIRKIKNPTDHKCMEITVTDPALIEKTGGIVQGMSGSPLIQDGKLIGAVTHVLVSDPTKGYGIFIENMLRQIGEKAA